MELTFDDDIKRLQGCINDLMSIQALPAIWSGQEPSQIVATLLDALVRVLRLDFAYARISAAIDGSPIELVRLPQRRTPDVQPQQVHRALEGWFTADRPDAPFVAPNPFGDGTVSMAPFRLRLHDEIGNLVAATTRNDFPTATELILLRVAVNQAVIGLQEARRLAEQKRTADEIERRVAERTEHLSAVNEELRREINRRKRARDALQQNEQRLRAILDNSPVLMFMKDINGHYLDCNSSFEKLCGSSRGQIIGKTDRELFAAEQAAQYESNDREILKTGTPLEFEGTALRPDGLHTSIVSKFPLRDGEDRIYAIVGIVTDIMERKRMEQTLQENQQRLRVALESSPVAFTILRAARDDRSHIIDFQWLYLNPVASRILGRAPEELIGRRVREVLPNGWEPPGLFECFVQVVNTGESQEIEVASGHNGINGWFYNIAAKLDDGVAVWFTDVTHRKRVEEELRRSEAFLAEGQSISHTGSWAVKFPSEDIFWSQEMFRIYGLDPATTKLSQQLAFQLIHSEDRALVKEAFERALRDKSDYTVEHRAILGDGSTKHLHALGRPVLNESGDLVECVGTVVDITDRKQAEEALRQSSRRIENILESITDEFNAFDREWRFTYVNEPALKSIRRAKGEALTREEILGKNVWEVFPEHMGSVFYHKYHEAMHEQKTVEFEALSPVTGRWIAVNAYPSEEGLSVYYRDITERKRAERQLAYHAHLLENVHDAVIATDERFVLTVWNKGAEEMYGWTADEVLGRNVFEVIPTELSDEQCAKARRELAETGRRRAEIITYRKDGTPVYAEGRSVALRSEQGRITGYLGVNRDITERKRAEEERAQLLRRLMAAQEDERRRIAREMHDQFGQEVSALTLKLAALKGAHGRQSELGEQLGALEAIARQLDQDLDFLIWEMRPTALDDLGLVIALSNYVENWSKHFGVHAELHASGMEKHRLTCEVETVLYRVTQEALNNIAKHARAANVHILLEHRLDHISLIIEDDGVGFDAEKIFDTGHTGLGLIGMRERAALVDGKLEIESHPGGGTTIVIRVRSPVVPKREEQDATFEHSLSRRS